MDRYHLPGRVAAGVLASTLGVAALLVAGCSSSPGGSGASGGSPSANSKSGGSGNSGGSGGSSGSTTASGSPLFPIAVGEKWVYAVHLGAALGSGTTTNTVRSVKPVSGGDLVTMTDATNVLGSPTKPGTVTYMFNSDGSISVPFTQFGGSKVTVKSGSIVWPPASVIASGQSHHSTLVVSIKMAGHALSETIHVTVQGAGTHTVTVPAGTYQATAVNQTMAESILGHPVKIEIRTWLAPGVGPVKTEVLGGGTLGSGIVEDLKSFTK
jgi:hypothetical protein